MAIEYKYGKVTTEYGNIGEEESVVIFRGRDKYLQGVLEYYYTDCYINDCSDFHLDLIKSTIDKIKEWQKVNGTQQPASKSYEQRIKGNT